mgnify:CR=1 FL=1
MSGGMQGGGGVPDDLLTTKGDTHGFDTANARVPIGADTQVLTADSTQALGLGWAAPTSAITTPAEFVNETWEVLDEHEVSDTNTSYTFTPASPLLWTQYDVIQIVTELDSNGNNDLRLRVNTAEGQYYHYAGIEIDNAGNESLIGANTVSHFLCGDQGRDLRGATQIIELRSMEGGGGDRMAIMCNSALQDLNASGFGYFQNYGFNGGQTDDTIVDIELSCTSSSWNAGGEIRILGRLKKAVP